VSDSRETIANRIVLLLFGLPLTILVMAITGDDRGREAWRTWRVRFRHGCLD